MAKGLISSWDNTSFHLGRVVYYAMFFVAVLFMLSYLVPELYTAAFVVLIFAAISVLVDFYLLYRQKNGVEAERTVSERLSNGDENKFSIHLRNNYDYKTFCTIID